MTHVTCRLTAKSRGRLRNRTLGNRVRASFTFSWTVQLAPVGDTGRSEPAVGSSCNPREHGHVVDERAVTQQLASTETDLHRSTSVVARICNNAKTILTNDELFIRPAERRRPPPPLPLSASFSVRYYRPNSTCSHCEHVLFASHLLNDVLEPAMLLAFARCKQADIAAVRDKWITAPGTADQLYIIPSSHYAAFGVTADANIQKQCHDFRSQQNCGK